MQYVGIQVHLDIGLRLNSHLIDIWTVIDPRDWADEMTAMRGTSSIKLNEKQIQTKRITRFKGQNEKRNEFEKKNNLSKGELFNSLNEA